MADPVVTYECPIAGTSHDLPGPDVRVLRAGDGGFVVACDCGPESLADADESPHPTVDHLVNVYADDPSPEQWLQLEAAADGWYDTTAFETPDGYEGTNGQRRERFREQVEELADEAPQNFENCASEEDVAAREVACPDCDANSGQQCQRPSGHHVQRSHAARIDKATAEGVIDPDQSANSSPAPSSAEQSSLRAFD